MKFLSLFLAALVPFSAISNLRAAEGEAAVSPELEAKFKATMTNSTMAGRWLPLKDGVLGAEKEDKYSIVSAEKVSGNSWVIVAKFKSIPIPVPVQVKWAGATPVIVVDNLQLPGAAYYGGSAYSARVMIYEGTYAGTWNGGGVGGMMSGVITKNEPAK